MKKVKNSETAEQPQDLLKIFMETGVTKEILLSLGFVGLGTDTPLEELPIEKRNAMINLCLKLHVVISEVLKSNEHRDNDKIEMFLKAAMQEADDFYKDDSENFLVHSLEPYEK